MNQPPLADDELEELRAIIEADRRMRWLKAGIRTYGAWVAGGLTVLLGFRDDVRDLVLWLTGRS